MPGDMGSLVVIKHLRANPTTLLRFRTVSQEPKIPIMPIRQSYPCWLVFEKKTAINKGPSINYVAQF